MLIDKNGNEINLHEDVILYNIIGYYKVPYGISKELTILATLEYNHDTADEDIFYIYINFLSDTFATESPINFYSTVVNDKSPEFFNNCINTFVKNAINKCVDECVWGEDYCIMSGFSIDWIKKSDIEAELL